MEVVDGRELCTRTLKAEEVIHCPLVIWISMTSSSSMAEGIGDAGHEEVSMAKEWGQGSWWFVE